MIYQLTTHVIICDDCNDEEFFGEAGYTLISTIEWAISHGWTKSEVKENNTFLFICPRCKERLNNK